MLQSACAMYSYAGPEVAANYRKWLPNIVQLAEVAV